MTDVGHKDDIDRLAHTSRLGLPAIGLVGLAGLALALAAVLVASPDEHYRAPGQVPSATVPAPELDIVTTRARARLRPCPAPLPTQPPPPAPVAVNVECLGDGTRVELSAVLAGRVTVLNLWARWCQVCRTELPVLDTYARAPGAAQVLGIEVHDEPGAGLSLLTALGVHFPSVTDTDDAAFRALHAPAYLPVTYVATPDGVIRQVLPRTLFTTVDQIDQAVRSMTTAPGDGPAHPLR